MVDSGSFNLNKFIFPAPQPALLGSVPNGGDVPGAPLTVSTDASGMLTLDWDASCLTNDGDYVVYEGSLDSFDTHAPVTCTTGGARTWVLSPDAGSSYYLVTPSNGVAEGSLGFDGSGAERPRGASACFQPSIGGCP